MKKFLSILLSIVILFLSASLICFAEDDNYDIIIRTEEVITFDKNANSSGGFLPGTTEITAVFRRIERFSSCIDRKSVV